MISHCYPNEEAILEDDHMSEDLEESDNEDAPAEAVDVQAEGEEVRINDAAAARTSRRVIKVVNKEITERQK